MKAILSRAPDRPLTLEDVADPVAAPGEVLIDVYACGVNYMDTLIVEDKYQTKPPRPFSPGAEVAGVVVDVGAGVTTVKRGDRVVAWNIYGGMAEKIAVSEKRCTALGNAVPFEIAATLLVAYGTSMIALRASAQLRTGETLLVLGAAGGVGLAAVELGKAMGAKVIAACSTQEKCDIARAHGADFAIMYPAGALTSGQSRSFKEAIVQIAPAGADVIYDPVGGDLAEAALRAIAWNGRFLVIGFASGIPKIPLNLLLLKNCSVSGVFSWEVMNRDVALYRNYMCDLLRLYESGTIKPRVSARFALADAGKAIAALQSRGTTGKVVVSMELSPASSP